MIFVSRDAPVRKVVNQKGNKMSFPLQPPLSSNMTCCKIHHLYTWMIFPSPESNHIKVWIKAHHISTTFLSAFFTVTDARHVDRSSLRPSLGLPLSVATQRLSVTLGTAGQLTWTMTWDSHGSHRMPWSVGDSPWGPIDAIFGLMMVDELSHFWLLSYI